MGVGGLSAWISSWVRRRSMIGPRAMGGGVGGALGAGRDGRWWSGWCTRGGVGKQAALSFSVMRRPRNLPVNE